MTTLLSYVIFTILFPVYGFRAAQHLKEAYLHNYDVASARAEASGKELNIPPEYPASCSAVVILAITFGGLLLMILGDLIPILGIILSVALVIFGFWFIISSKISKYQIRAIQNALYVVCFTFIFSLTSIVFRYDRTGGLRTVIVFLVSIVATFLLVKLLGLFISKSRSKKRTNKRKPKNEVAKQTRQTASPQSSTREHKEKANTSSGDKTADPKAEISGSETLAVVITTLSVIGFCIAWIIVLV